MPQFACLNRSVGDFRLLHFKEGPGIVRNAGAMSADQIGAWTRHALAEARPTSGA